MKTKNIEAVLTTVTIDTKVDAGKIETVIGESAKMEVQKAVNYIQSGKAEIDAAVDARLAEIDAEGQEYVDLAKDWAIKTDGTVDGVDYSSKYYAQSILPIASDITTVAGIASDVSAVGGAVSEVVAVAGDLTNIDAVNSNKTNIDTVAGISSDVSTVSGISADVSAVSANSTNINTVAGISSDVTTTAGIASDISSVAGNATDISAVANDLTNIDSVAGDLSNIDAVNANKTNIDAVVGNATNINAVAGDLTNINSVAGDLTNINAVAGDLTNIDNASSYAAEAKQWAIGDPTEPSGNSAKYWAEEADTSETNAEIWAEGTDEEVQALGGVHSSKGWADQSSQGQVQSNWTEADPTSKAYILNKPTIPTVNNATLTIQKNGTTVKTFTANASSNVTANITVPTNTNELTNGAGFITGISSSDVTTALGYTPANDGNVVKTSGNQTINGEKTLTSQIKATLASYSATSSSTNTKPYKKIGSCVLTGTYQSAVIPFLYSKTVVQTTNGTYEGRICLRVDGTAGTLSTSTSGIILSTYPDFIQNGNINFYICYKNNYPESNQVTCEIWVYIGGTYQGVNIIPMRVGTGGGAYSTSVMTWGNNLVESETLPDGYSSKIHNVSDVYVKTPATGDNSTKVATTAFVNQAGDGQWVYSSSVVASTVNVSSSDATYSLSSYLPNDGHKYEVLFNVAVTTPGTLGKYSLVVLSSSEVTEINAIRTQTPANVSIASIASCIIPIGTNRNVIVEGQSGANAAGTYTLTAKAYRRIGTNS